MRSYVSLYCPAMVAIIADGLAILTIAVASIPLMQKLAFVASFWIISIFFSVVTLHPDHSLVRAAAEGAPPAGMSSTASTDGISSALHRRARHRQLALGGGRLCSS